MSLLSALSVSFYLAAGIMYAFAAMAFRKERIVVFIFGGLSVLFITDAIVSALAAYARIKGWAL